MKILTIIGARPQFVKASVVSKALSACSDEILVHTGQHYDKNMSDVFFNELGIPKPKYNLNVGSGGHGKQTGEMLMRIESVILDENPDVVLVYGDTNSTIAGALAASKLHIPVAHVEAGLRSYNMRMPEEQNRILTDHISKWLLCPTDTAVKNLAKEGITEGVHNVGDVMLDSVMHFLEVAKANEEKCKIFDKVGVVPKEYKLATLHRAETTDGGENALKEIFTAFEQLPNPVVFPAHPRVRSLAKQVLDDNKFSNTKLIEPLGYLEMLLMTSNANQILTDSGGLQKEAWFMNVPCVTLRTETEWIETLEGNWNILAKIEEKDIIEKAMNTIADPAARDKKPFGNADASEKIAKIITQ